MEDFRCVCVVDDIEDIRTGLTSDDETGSGTIGIGGIGCLICTGMCSSVVGMFISEN